ncbi:MAG: 16S rRNA (cytidine(1402)-2'-O)-methyltransferase [Alkaliphilus sp.]|nr:16S rRNA (cytidine(1402)-2'-O)-methyltransferase [bacterium AH-315-K05]PHS31296.1 MAG: 16S rRNA (cytidine(1402)-2'-O)-methyltransferase [Alkaliphilus sp.]
MGKLFVVPTPIGNLGDITKRAVEVLGDCDLIAAEDTRVTKNLLNHLNIKKNIISYHKFNEATRKNELIKKLKEDDFDICLVTDAGTPCISDPGYFLVREAIENDISVIGLPGASAVTTALSVSGIKTDEFAFFGFLPGKKSALIKKLSEIKENSVRTFVLYESPRRIVKLLEAMNDVLPNTYVCVCNDLTKYYEKSYYGNVPDVILQLKENEKHEKGEYTVVGRKAKKEEEVEDEFCYEAHVINEMIKRGVSSKEAISITAKKLQVPKKDVYKAWVDLKEFME